MARGGGLVDSRQHAINVKVPEPESSPAPKQSCTWVPSVCPEGNMLGNFDVFRECNIMQYTYIASQAGFQNKSEYTLVRSEVRIHLDTHFSVGDFCLKTMRSSSNWIIYTNFGANKKTCSKPPLKNQIATF